MEDAICLMLKFAWQPELKSRDQNLLKIAFQFCFFRDERGSILQLAAFAKKEKFYIYF